MCLLSKLCNGSLPNCITASYHEIIFYHILNSMLIVINEKYIEIYAIFGIRYLKLMSR